MQPQTPETDPFSQIESDIKNNPVVLYMKGTADTPMCGFSAVAVEILKSLNIPFRDVNVLENPQVRQAIKEYSNWPTIPQLYVKGEFVGGCDIMREMLKTKELQELFENKGIIKKV